MPEPAGAPAPDASAAVAPAREDGTDPCAAAFEEQLTVYLGVDVLELGVHPARKARFLEHCRSMPPTFQRCASPLYVIQNDAECAVVHGDVAAPVRQHWLEMFEVLTGTPESLSKAPGEGP